MDDFVLSAFLAQGAFLHIGFSSFLSRFRGEADLLGLS